MSGSFVRRVIKITITLGTGNFGTTGANQLTIQGLRVLADIKATGGPAFTQASIRVFGMKQADMNQLTVLSFGVKAIVRNTIKVEADGATVFEGDILNAWADYQSAPDVPMLIDAQSAFFAQVAPTAPASVNGSADVAVMLQSIAIKMGLTFENNGVTARLGNPYLPGTLVDQAKAIAKAASVDLYIDRGIMAICPKGGPRKAGEVPLISPATGLLGYPTFDRMGVTFGCIFNPAIQFGGRVQVDTQVVQARGTWKVTGLTHTLESEKQGGQWTSQVKCTETGLVAVR
jgi:hypothetical protein